MRQVDMSATTANNSAPKLTHSGLFAGNSAWRRDRWRHKTQHTPVASVARNRISLIEKPIWPTCIRELQAGRIQRGKASKGAAALSSPDYRGFAAAPSRRATPRPTASAGLVQDGRDSFARP